LRGRDEFSNRLTTINSTIDFLSTKLSSLKIANNIRMANQANAEVLQEQGKFLTVSENRTFLTMIEG
jgi:hypothetical protein